MNSHCMQKACCENIKMIKKFQSFNNYLPGVLSSITELYNERTINKGRFLAEIRLTGIEGRLLGQTYWIKLINDSTFSSVFFFYIFYYGAPLCECE